MSAQTKTIGEMLEYGQKLFEQSDIYFGHGTDNAWDEAVYLLSSVLKLPPDESTPANPRPMRYFTVVPM